MNKQKGNFFLAFVVFNQVVVIGEDLMSNISKVFNEAAETYDSNRRKFIPCFDRFYGTALEIIKFKPNKPIKVLDLGAGTGLLSQFVFNVYPKAQITLIDLAEGMLEQAKKRLVNWENQIEIIVGNYLHYPFQEQFDLVISGLSIHHLDGNEKQQLFANIYQWLKQEGQFINADQVLGATAKIESIYRKTWDEQVRNLGISEDELAKAYERMKEDKMSTLEEQLTWLKEAKFSEVNCWFKDYSFVVYSGEKKE